MIPTSHLRFVIRYEPTPIRILQQWWAIDPNDEDDFIQKINGYWQDIGLENEND